MTLASMIRFDEDALICDLAETYHIYDYRSLPVRLVATLAAGLRDDSRIKLLKTNSPVSQDTALLAVIADRIEGIRYMWADDAVKQAHPPVSMTELIFSDMEKKNTNEVSFDTSQEFEAALAKIRGH